MQFDFHTCRLYSTHTFSNQTGSVLISISCGISDCVTDCTTTLMSHPIAFHTSQSHPVRFIKKSNRTILLQKNETIGKILESIIW